MTNLILIGILYMLACTEIGFLRIDLLQIANVLYYIRILVSILFAGYCLTQIISYYKDKYDNSKRH